MIDKQDVQNKIREYSIGISKNQGNADNVDRSIQMAFRDLCRTIRMPSKSGMPKSWSDFEDKDGVKKEWSKIIKRFIEKIINTPNFTVTLFDSEHKKACGFLTVNLMLTYGQAQKWVNMTLKNIFALEFSTNPKPQWLEFAHIPLDSYIFEALEKNYSDYKNLKIPKNKTPWSKISNYDDYMELQKWWRGKKSTEYPGLTPLESEFVLWSGIVSTKTKLQKP